MLSQFHLDFEFCLSSNAGCFLSNRNRIGSSGSQSRAKSSSPTKVTDVRQLLEEKRQGLSQPRQPPPVASSGKTGERSSCSVQLFGPAVLSSCSVQRFGPAVRSSGSVQLFGPAVHPAVRSSGSVQLFRPAVRSSGSVQLFGPAVRSSCLFSCRF